MSRASVIALVLAGILFGCAAGMVAREALEPRAVAYAGERWEYMTSAKGFSELEFLEQANALGANGWELVTSIGGVPVYKRPLGSVATIKPIEKQYDYEDE